MTTPQNSLIASLPKIDRQRLLAPCQPIELVLADVLCERSTTTDHVYFPVDGFISLAVLIDDQPALEVGMIGREGMRSRHGAGSPRARSGSVQLLLR